MVPIYLAGLSLTTNVIHILWSRYSHRESRDTGKSDDHNIAARSFKLGANLVGQSPTLLGLRFLRVACCFALGIISYLVSTERDCNSDKKLVVSNAAVTAQKCTSDVSGPELLQVLFYVSCLP